MVSNSYLLQNLLANFVFLLIHQALNAVILVSKHTQLGPGSLVYSSTP